jgi:succinoglycan biosynthesis transport protein ExoP
MGLRNHELDAREALLIHYWYILQKRKLVVFLFTLVLTITVIIGTLLSTRYYRSTAILEIAPKAPVYLDVEEVSEMASTSSTLEMRAYYGTQYRIIKSRTVIEETIRRLRELHGVTDFDEIEKPVEFFKAHMRVEPDAETHLVNIVLEYPDPEKAALFANTLARVYMDSNINRTLSTTEQALEWLKEQQEVYRSRKRDSDRAVASFKADNDLVGVREDHNTTQHTLTKLQEEWSTVHTHRVGLEADYERMAELDNANEWKALANLLMADSEVLVGLMVAHKSLEQERSSLEARYKEMHPKMSRIDSELASLEAQVRANIREVISGKRAELEVVTNREMVLGDELELVKNEAKLLEAKLLELEFLESDADRDELFYKNLDLRMSEVDLSRVLQANNISFVDPAIPGYEAVRPVLLVNVGMGLLMGLFGGCALAFFMEYLDSTVKSREDVESVVGMNFVGVVPLIAVEEAKSITPGRDRNIFVYTKPRSAVAESLRSIRTNLLFRSRQKPLRRLLITSAVPREGKSFISANLAALIAMTGSRVLLIDADLRRPNAHKLYEMPNDIGLSNVLAGELPFTSAVTPTHVPGLDVLVAGPMPPNPAELLGGEKLGDLLDSIKGYDMIIVDTPPVNVVADPLMIANLVDGVLVVIEANRTSRSLVIQTRSRLGEVDANVLGAVVNKLNTRNAGYGYYYYYYDGYQYYTAEPEDTSAPAQTV